MSSFLYSDIKQQAVFSGYNDENQVTSLIIVMLAHSQHSQLSENRSSVMKRILVPCDFSAPARQAYKFAINLATASGGEVIVLYNIPAPIIYETTFGIQPYPLNPLEIQEMEDNARKVFERMKKIHPAPANLRVSFFALYSEAVTGILKFSKKRKIDLIVMGTHGSSGFEEFMIGSTTEKIVRLSKVPVIALRKASFFSSIKNIVFPTTLELNQTELIKRIKTLQKFFDARLHILLINTPDHFKRDQDAKETLQEFVKYYKLENCTVNFRSSPTERDGILDFVNEIKADMLAMATHGRRGLAHLFSGSITESVVNHVKCPIWTYRLQKK
jgi:nucleotide-binding universal stress UspA family protein